MSKTPWMNEAEKHKGKKETDSKFGSWLSGFWGKVGLPQFKSIIGSKNAWCGLFVGAMLATAGFSVHKRGAAAISWSSYGQPIQYKLNGAPRGGIARVNGKGDCSSAKNNHVTFLNGDCTADDFKSGSVNALGGNQGDQVKVSAYPVKNICSITWPK
jgi:uncharacterized protein (TIGR02594 family)